MVAKTRKVIEEFYSIYPSYLKRSALDAYAIINTKTPDISKHISSGDIEKIRKELRNKVYPRTNENKKPNIIIKTTKIDTSKVVDKFSIREPIRKRNTPGVYFITGCVHAPWQNQAMYDSVFNYINTEVGPLTGVILAGDIVDMNSLSKYSAGSVPLKGVTLDWEYEQACKFLDQVDAICSKGTSKDYIFGNHEDRYSRYMSNIDNSKLGKSLQSPEVGLKLAERGFNVLKNWKNDAISLGPYLDVIHGEFLNVHTAKKTIDTYRKSVLYFHTHRFQVYVEGLTGGWNMGLGANINAEIFNYATKAMRNSWLNACCLVFLDKDGFYHVQPLVYINNKLIVNGKSY